MVAEFHDALDRKHEADAARNQCPVLTLLAITLVCGRVGHKKSWIWQEVKAGRFPKPIHCGRSARWISAEIDAWIRARISESRVGG